jgi:hypothetical protein
LTATTTIWLAGRRSDGLNDGPRIAMCAESSAFGGHAGGPRQKNARAGDGGVARDGDFFLLDGFCLGPRSSGLDMTRAAP